MNLEPPLDPPWEEDAPEIDDVWENDDFMSRMNDINGSFIESITEQPDEVLEDMKDWIVCGKGDELVKLMRKFMEDYHTDLDYNEPPEPDYSELDEPDYDENEEIARAETAYERSIGL